ncbi:MAG: BAX inhibitor (BI)-1/YccA family protein, partial [Alphaproteobacteria bacterium]|nr:BAX inhibitor (BI)-1/YccA family protein [Alphaproteobacteria bacterium]
IRRTYYQVAGNAELAAKASVMGALSLYLDFINMFQFLIQFLGDRR